MIAKKMSPQLSIKKNIGLTAILLSRVITMVYSLIVAVVVVQISRVELNIKLHDHFN